MNIERQEAAAGLDQRTLDALQELQRMIGERYPGTGFEVSRGHDEPENIHLTAIVDLDDPDEVFDLVAERLDQLQVEERIPVHVIPIRTPERVLAMMKSEVGTRGSRRRQVPLLRKANLLP